MVIVPQRPAVEFHEACVGVTPGMWQAPDGCWQWPLPPSSGRVEMDVEDDTQDVLMVWGGL